MRIENYDILPEGAKQIRIEVFMKEQGFVDEFDDIDGIATHLVMLDGDTPVATGRFYTENNSEYYFGRLAVAKSYRGKGLGSDIVTESERLIKQKGGSAVLLHSQCQAQPFYERLGYTAFGESDFDEDCPHQWMRKEL